LIVVFTIIIRTTIIVRTIVRSIITYL
jgi:hypothetical protein